MIIICFFRPLWVLYNMQTVSQVLKGSGMVITGEQEDGIIIPPLTLIHLPRRAVKGMEQREEEEEEARVEKRTPK